MSSTNTEREADDPASREPEKPFDESPVDARVYRLLGEQLLTRPDRERVDAVGAWAREWLATADSLPVEIETALRRIADGSEADIEPLRTAYTHLFRGVSESDPDPPYESMYVGSGFYSETTTEIRQGYRWAGVDVDTAAGNEPPDHLGLELQFLGELMTMDDTEADSDEPDVEDAKWWLLYEHLAEWVPTYMARIQQADPHDYYAGLVELALALVNAHCDRLEGRR
ncbi:TorD/DmsD family molecular chaperone [Halorubrum tebenquichense]|uniref:Cytoplasmic chaperone TorD family protein n=1 Tax=Halorubrum tebenquichense DSM 14210 TaxID=1227485 RepID=M0DBQ0_9EURY|nr:molecular chaperone TorD family protein [Halorubrum tebenquichense]ELZ32891.1 cytoplasmic chaperone TorD family protein [Halorubrum tebenquichense DSM 14210]